MGTLQGAFPADESTGILCANVFVGNDHEDELRKSLRTSYSNKFSDQSELTEKLITEVDDTDQRGCCEKCCDKCVVS